MQFSIFSFLFANVLKYLLFLIQYNINIVVRLYLHYIQSILRYFSIY